MMKRIAIVLTIAGLLAGAVLWVAVGLECEFPFWPTLWLASQTKVPDGTRISQLVQVRAGSSHASQHWHHCAWCDEIYTHVPHSAVKVTFNTNRNDFYLFDWDVWHQRLLPATARTARLFPELIPAGSVVEVLGVGLNPQLYPDDKPCRVVIK